MLDYQLTQFSNGLKLITSPLKNTKAVTVLFLVATGSRYETKDLNGIAHFLEHMFFKGTKKRPNTLDIARALDGVGAAYNAFTSEEHTGFYVRAESSHFDLALDVLFDMLYGSKFETAEIEREKGVVVEEINMYQDTPSAYIAEVAKRLLYGDHPLGREVSGLKETVGGFGRSDLINFRDRFYTPNKMIVAIAGGPVSTRRSSRGGQNSVNWQAKVKNYFEKIDLKGKASCEKVKESQTKPELLIHHKKTDQAHLILGFRTVPRTDERRPILKVLNNLLGENMSSRLFTEVRERRGLAYYVSSEMASFIDAGALGASAGVDIRRAEEAVKVILAEFERLKSEPVTAVELKKAKENMKGRLYLGLEESFEVADFLAEQELFWGKIKTPETLVAEYEKVTPDDIQQFAKEFFVPERLNLALIGPFKKQTNFQKILVERF